MKVALIILFCAFCSIECRKLVQISKNANVDFINMEAGSHGLQPATAPSAPAKPIPPPSPTQSKTPTSPVTTAKPVAVPVVPSQPPKPSQPQQNVQPGKPGGNTVTTPVPGNVKQLVTFYDSQGKASLIRPYSYSEAVKKGKA